MPHGFAALATSTMACVCALLLLADYGWERRKRDAANRQASAVWIGPSYKPAEYRSYSWIRYLAIILITYINVEPILTSEPPTQPVLFSPARIFYLFSLVVLLSIAFLKIDNYWDRRRARTITTPQAFLFWCYFWIRYPALIAATIQATRGGLTR